jgi:hypothetical protein
MEKKNILQLGYLDKTSPFPHKRVLGALFMWVTDFMRNPLDLTII